MTEEAKALMTRLCARPIERLRDMTPMEIEASLNEYAALVAKHRECVK